MRSASLWVTCFCACAAAMNGRPRLLVSVMVPQGVRMASAAYAAADRGGELHDANGET